MSEFSAQDWTLARYAEILDATRLRYAFEPYGTSSTAPHALWRHDIDYSVDCALAFARLEAERGLRATYFFLLGSIYYNPFHPPVRSAIVEIVRLGHWIGLHFDPLAVARPDSRTRAYADEVALQASVLSGLASAPVSAVSFHNPAFAGVLDMDAPRIGGLINAYAADLRRDYLYASDSFGYWRHTPLDRVVTEHTADRLHILTHPVWWRDKPEGSRRRIADAADAAATAILGEHDRLLERAGLFETVRNWDEERNFQHPPDRRG